MKVNIVVISISNGMGVSQWAVPFSNIKEAKIYAGKVMKYWTGRTIHEVKVTVSQALPVRDKVGRDWRKAGVEKTV